MIDIPDSVFPKDLAGNLLCPKCAKTIALCTCPGLEVLKPKEPKICPKIRVEKSGRQGKVVTVITNLPARDFYLKDLAKKLKAMTGSGGTFYIKDAQGVVEVQGDHQLKLRDYFK